MKKLLIAMLLLFPLLLISGCEDSSSGNSGSQGGTEQEPPTPDDDNTGGGFEPKLFTNPSSHTGFYIDENADLYITGRHFYDYPTIQKAGLGVSTTYSNYEKFTKVKEVSNVKKAVGSPTHILILTYDGDLYVWGYDVFNNSDQDYNTYHYGVLGLGKAPENATEDEEKKYYNASIPRKINFPENVKIKDIDAYVVKLANNRHGSSSEGGISIAVSEDNKIYGWGRNLKYLFDKTSEDGVFWEPTLIDDNGVFNNLSITKIGLGDRFLVVLADDRYIYGMGGNKSGLNYKLGINDSRTKIFPPEKIEVLNVENQPIKIKDISTSQSGTLLIGEDNYGYAFGAGCIGTEIKRLCSFKSSKIVPSRILDVNATDNDTYLNDSIKYMSIGNQDSNNSYILLGADGSVYGWGENDTYQLGIKADYSYNDTQVLTTASFKIPQDIKEIDLNYKDYSYIESNYQKPKTQWQDKKFKSISIGNGFTYGMTEDGAMYSWGSNSEGQLGSGGITDDDGEVTGAESTYEMQKIIITK